VLALAGISYTQTLPSSIRGYKVHQVQVHVRTAGDKETASKDATVKVGEPHVIDVGLAASHSKPWPRSEVSISTYRSIS
jgi:hypothetical protein